MKCRIAMGYQEEYKRQLSLALWYEKTGNSSKASDHNMKANELYRKVIHSRILKDVRK